MTRKNRLTYVLLAADRDGGRLEDNGTTPSETEEEEEEEGYDKLTT
jgi:hypothetical protein